MDDVEDVGDVVCVDVLVVDGGYPGSIINGLEGGVASNLGESCVDEVDGALVGGFVGGTGSGHCRCSGQSSCEDES